jgi:flagellar biosynthesis chaperone FliJ
MQEEKQRNAVKAELMKEQRVMDSFSIESKEL